MVRLNDISIDRSLDCVNSLKKGNIPLIVVDIKKRTDYKELLKEIAFKADLFIAAENVSSLEEAYSAAGNGAQFFILENSDLSLMKTLKEYGFYFIPRAKTADDIKICEELEMDCVICDDNNLIKGSKLANVFDEQKSSLTTNSKKDYLFTIVDLPDNEIDFEMWINREVKKMLGLNYTTVEVKSDASEDEKFFAEVFASTEKCKTIINLNNIITLECVDLVKAVNYFKWREIYIDPDKSEIANGKISKGPLDKKLCGFTIMLKEKENLWVSTVY